MGVSRTVGMNNLKFSNQSIPVLVLNKLDDVCKKSAYRQKVCIKKIRLVPIAQQTQ